MFMTGLIWFVQVVHYPLKAFVGRVEFLAYQEAHVRRTGWVVGPPMLAEVFTLALLLWDSPFPRGDGLLLASAVVLLLIWGATAVFSVPAHGRLAQGFEVDVHRRLVLTNWLRTFGWSLRSLLLLVYIAQLCFEQGRA